MYYTIMLRMKKFRKTYENRLLFTILYWSFWFNTLTKFSFLCILVAIFSSFLFAVFNLLTGYLVLKVLSFFSFLCINSVICSLIFSYFVSVTGWNNMLACVLLTCFPWTKPILFFVGLVLFAITNEYESLAQMFIGL